jgi:hypothetical protein
MMAVILAEHSWWHTWGELTIWLAGVATAIGLLSKTRPARWMWRRLISDPFTDWFRTTGGEIIEEKVGKEFASNGGASLRDAIDGLKDGQDTLTEWSSEAIAGQKAVLDRVDANSTAIAEMSGSIGTTLADHGTRITAMEGRHEDVMTAIERLHKCVERRLAATDDTGERRREEDAEPEEATNP